jgi:hypothetical protein
MSKEVAKAKDTFTLRVPKNRAKTEYFEIELRDLNDEQLYMMILSYINAGKSLDAVRMMVRELRVSGDSAEEFGKNFRAVQSAEVYLAELITPLEGELKKN